MINTAISKTPALLFLACMALCFAASAQTFNFHTRDENEIKTAVQIKAHGLMDTIIVRQDKWNEMISNSNWSQNLKFKSVHDYVRFSVNHAYPIKVDSAYTLRLTYKLYGYANPADTGSASVHNDTLTISYNPDSLARYQDVQYKSYSNYHKIMIVLTGLYKLYGPGTTPVAVDMTPYSDFSWLNFNVEGAITVQPFQKKAGGVSVYGPSAPPLAIQHQAPGNNTLLVQWTVAGGSFSSPPELLPAKYELEWVYVDNYRVDGTGSVSTVPASQLAYHFKDNATRVVLEDNHYSIPLIYQKGHIIYRVRLVRPDSVQFKYSVYGPWSLYAASGTVGSVPSASRYEITTPYMNDSINWQYTISFAEQGKFKHVLSYYDGMLKNRQSITRFNSKPAMLIATGQVYDYEGRPSISILPTPIRTPYFTYQHNLSLNAETGLPYKAADFDGMQLYACPADPETAPLHSTALARLYYSPGNTDQSGLNKFIPDAEGYPFVQTMYSPGYDERVEKQGGAGAALQIGAGHYTRNDYVNADQTDLNRLFGLNIGRSGFYRKTVTKDPNGQLSLNVTDYNGKTVTSSLVGVPDTTHLAIERNTNVPDSAMVNEEHIAGSLQQIINNQRILDKQIFMDVSGNCQTRYIYNFTPYQVPFCPEKYLSVAAWFRYQAADECGTVRTADSGTLGITGVMTDAQVVSYPSPTQTDYLEQGPYTLHKKLIFNPNEVYAAVDSFMQTPDNCLRTEEWFVKEEVLSTNFPCPNMDCNTCEDKKAEMMRELWPNLDGAYEKRKYGRYMITPAGLVLGNNNSIFTALGGGALIYDSTGNVIIGDGAPQPVNFHYRYQDSCITLPASVVKNGVTYTNLAQLPVETFMEIFNDEIAEALLPLHPEYCKLLACVDDPFYSRLHSVPDYTTAMAIGLYQLTDIINADPVYAALSALPAGFPDPEDTLSRTAYGMRIDSLALVQAYCNCQDSTMYNNCIQDIFSQPISALVLDHPFIKERYYDNLTALYLANRARYLSYLSPQIDAAQCEICKGLRMSLVPPPVFTQFTDENGNPATGPGSFLGTAFGMGGTDSTNAAQFLDMTNLLTNLDSLQPAYDSAVLFIQQTEDTLCNGAIDVILQNLANCADSAGLVPVRNYLEGQCNAGLVNHGRFRPAQIRNAILSAGLSMSDLCNPYLTNYDALPFPASDDGSNIVGRGFSYYAGFTDFMNTKALPALTSLNTVHNATLSGATDFELGLTDAIGGTGARLVAAYNAAEDTYLLRVYKNGGTDTVRFWFKGGAVEAGGCQQAFDIASGQTVSCNYTDFINNISAGFTKGYIGLYTLVTVMARTENGVTLNCPLLVWNDRIQVNKASVNPLLDCIPCTQIREAYGRFRDTLAVYGVKGTDHPFYEKMLRNFLNHTLKTSFTDYDYTRFIESCALTDSMGVNRYGAYSNFVFGSDAAANSFITALHNVDTEVYIVPVIRYKDENSHVTVLLNLNTIPQQKLRLYKSFLLNYPGSGFLTRGVNERYAATDTATVAYIFMPATSSLPPAADIFGSASPDTFSFTTQTVTGQFDYGELPWKRIAVRAPSGATPAAVAGNLNLLEQYLYTHPLTAQLLPLREYWVDADYYKPDKKAYLQYTYAMQPLPAYQVLDTVQPYHLTAEVPGYAGRTLSYGTQALPGRVENLYLTNGNPQENTQAAQLNYMLSQITTQLSGGIFFGGSPIHSIINSDENRIDGIRCGNHQFWYRYFGPGDSLFNIFIPMPDYIQPEDYTSYELLSFHPVNGDTASYAFALQIRKQGQPGTELELKGYTDFVVARNGKLSNVLLAHPAGLGVPIADTGLNCERLKLINAITQGKIKYQQYIDSIRTLLYNNFAEYIMNTGVQEQLYMSYMGQRFNYTLYYYDRAGNLIQTVPPAGVVMLNEAATAEVDSIRLADTVISGLLPVHKKPSVYHYNSLNLPYEQKTPDGGRTTFYYDAAGRLIFSQNDKQKPLSRYTYTLYDKQGRIDQTGEVKIGCTWFAPYTGSPAGATNSCIFYDAGSGMITSVPPIVTDLKSYTHDEVRSYIGAKTRYEVVVTLYDTPALDLSVQAGFSTQENLRKRVSCIKYYDALGTASGSSLSYAYAMHFSYDIAGNVKTLTRDYPALKAFGHRYKRIDYDYDQISGKVNMLSYNRGFADQFYQRYGYDADNRITLVETSSDGIIWDRDAAYQYYDHGPLARLSLGDLRVQGADYAYTIQGWLKAVNGDLLNATMDMGGDGAGSSVHAPDAAALSLDYFTGDYKPIGNVPLTHLSPANKSLYNGNIPRATTAILPFEDLQSRYTYDQLNRLMKAEYSVMNRQDSALAATPNYYNHYAYDPDGNLQRLVRRGNLSTTLMDTLIYHYAAGNNDNKLNNITDYAADNFSNDIRQFTNASVSRYLYDNTGNVIKDLVSGQDSIRWNHYNKVTQADKTDSGTSLSFRYDGAGQRYLKSLNRTLGDSTSSRSDYYVRDAQGNILTIYKMETDQVKSTTHWTWDINEWIIGTGGVSMPDWLNIFIGPVYALEGSFQGSALAAMAADNAWTDATLGDYPSSLYFNSEAVQINTMNYGSGNYAALLGALQQYTQQQGKPVLADALYQNIIHNPDNSHNPFVDLLERMLTVSDPDMVDTVLTQLCNADSILYNLNINPDSACAVKKDKMHRAIKDRGANRFATSLLHAFFEREAVTEMQAFLAGIAGSAAIQQDSTFTDRQSPNSLVEVYSASLAKYGNDTLLGDFMDDWSAGRSWLYGANDAQDLLAVPYEQHPDSLLYRYITAHGNDIAIVNDALQAIPGLEFTTYFNNAIEMIPAIPFYQVKDVLKRQKISLASHVMYGSSRLGTKDYLSGQHYALWDYTGAQPVVDSVKLNSRQPWYSLEYNDDISYLTTQPWGWTQNGSFYVQRQLGLKQYELNNHLGNVQATVTDKPVQQWSGGTWTHNMPALASAYDYYPFGMLMPGRYISDTSVHCMTISTTQWVTTTFFMEVFCGDCPGINIIPLGGTQYQLQLQDGGFDMAMPIGGSATMDFIVEPGMDNRFEFEIKQISGNAQIRFAITEDSMGMPKEIGSELITKTGACRIDFKPTGNTITLHISNENQSRTVAFSITGIAKIGTKTVQETILVDVCDEDKDRYRFGFNGQEKVNEWSGIGNFNEFSERGQDTRTGRFITYDPLAKDYPWNSPYAFAENDVIRAIDLEGLERLIMTGVNKDNRTAALTIKKDIEIVNSSNLPGRYKNISEKNVQKNFEFGNTTLYVKELPVNGSPVEFITKSDWKQGKGYSLDVVYDISVKVIDPSERSKSPNGDRGRISTVIMGPKSAFESDPNTTGAAAGADPTGMKGGKGNTMVLLNPDYGNGTSAEGVITHEVGIHNMAQKKHKLDKDGKPVYPEKGLESNRPDKIYPLEEETKQIINVNLQEGRLDTNVGN